MFFSQFHKPFSKLEGENNMDMKEKTFAAHSKWEAQHASWLFLIA